MIANVLAYLPPWTLLGLFCALNIVRYENRNWVLVRAGGKRGANKIGGLLVDLIGGFTLFFYWSFLFSFGHDHGIWSAVILQVIAHIAGLLALWLFHPLLGANNFPIMAISTILIIPLQILLFPTVNWFGWFS
jgi:hypothetical protein